MNVVVNTNTGTRNKTKENPDHVEKPLDLDADALRDYMLKKYHRRELRRTARKKWQTFNSQRMLNAKEEKE